MRPSGRVTSLIPSNKYLALLALIVLAVSTVELAAASGIPVGIIKPGSSATSYFSSERVISLMTSLGYLSLFVLMTLESASLPIPSEVVLPFAGYLVYIGVMNLGVALVLSTLAALLGALIDYYLALILGRVFVERFLGTFKVDHRSLDTAERWFNEKGAWTVLVARFVPLLRSVISLPAGLFEMPLWSFVLFTSIGCLAWNVVLIYAGYVTGPLWESVVDSSFTLLVNSLLAVLAAGSAIYLVYYGYSKTKRSG